MPHTPGPWECHPIARYFMRDCSAKLQLINLVNGMNRIAATISGTLPAEEAVANAYLVSAAPEMLAALEDAYALFVNGDLPENSTPTQIKAAMLYAIAKAKGEQP